MKKLYIVSLGCAKNLVDSETIVSKFKEYGFELSFDENNADVVLINTCGFLKSSIKESDEIIKHFIKLKKDGRIKNIVVFGCLVERFKGKIIEKYPDVNGFFGVGAWNFIEKFLKGRDNFFIEENKDLSFESRYLLTQKHSAYLKIADGCDNFCSYCTIPLIRGRFRSKNIEDIIEETKKLVKSGAKEISLIAQDTTKYGYDIYGEYKLVELLEKLEKIKGLKWIRLMYLYPSLVDKRLINRIKNSSKIVHYLELPFQHISDKILKLMNRKYDSKKAYEVVDMLKKEISDIALRTTFIVGFPGETEKDFEKLIEFLNYCRFNSVGVFKYSKEEGTKAYSLKQIDRKTKNLRYNKLILAQSKIVDEINKNLIGKEFEVLFDSANIARSYMDAPDIDGRFEIINYKGKPGEFKRVKIIEAKGYLRKATISKK